MSAESRHAKARALRPDELNILLAITMDLPKADLYAEYLRRCSVREMTDGAMGSLEFIDDGRGEMRRLGSVLVEAEGKDVDGIAVMLAVNLDEAGKLFEFDVWKVDYSPLQKLPEPSQVRLKMVRK